MLLGQSRTMFVYCSSEDSIMGGIEESPEERHAHAPPPSLVPRLHAVLANHLTHINPYMPGYKEEAYKEGTVVKFYNVRTGNKIYLNLCYRNLTCCIRHFLLSIYMPQGNICM